MSVRILIGDCRERLRELDPASVDSCVTDPPYHLTSIVKRFGAANAAPAKVGKTGAYARASRGFMGQTWDGGDVAFDPETWAEVLRVLKPGAHLVAFSGTRTYHRMACAIEDAGFEIRDQLAWTYGSGFPKSHNQPGGWGTALKPAWEPICLARKPLHGTVATNMATYGTGALNIDGCRIETFPDDAVAMARCNSQGSGRFVATPPTDGRFGRPTASAPLDTTRGRWPANIIHDGSEEVLAGFPYSKSEGGDGYKNSMFCGGKPTGGHGLGDEGSAARFFKECNFGDDEWRELVNLGLVAKCADSQCDLCGTPTADDPAGTKTLASKSAESQAGQRYACRGQGAVPRFLYCPKATTEERGEGNNHPTVKPVDLMRWLCRLVTPKGGTVLDPFAGSGSTLIAADAEQFHAIGCELSPDYAAIAERRVREAAGMFAEVQAA